MHSTSVQRSLAPSPRPNSVAPVIEDHQRRERRGSGWRKVAETRWMEAGRPLELQRMKKEEAIKIARRKEREMGWIGMDEPIAKRTSSSVPLAQVEKIANKMNMKENLGRANKGTNQAEFNLKQAQPRNRAEEIKRWDVEDGIVVQYKKASDSREGVYAASAFTNKPTDPQQAIAFAWQKWGNEVKSEHFPSPPNNIGTTSGYSERERMSQPRQSYHDLPEELSLTWQNWHREKIREAPPTAFRYNDNRVSQALELERRNDEARRIYEEARKLEIEARNKKNEMKRKEDGMRKKEEEGEINEKIRRKAQIDQVPESPLSRNPRETTIRPPSGESLEEGKIYPPSRGKYLATKLLTDDPVGQTKGNPSNSANSPTPLATASPEYRTIPNAKPAVRPPSEFKNSQRHGDGTPPWILSSRKPHATQQPMDVQFMARMADIRLQADGARLSSATLSTPRTRHMSLIASTPFSESFSIASPPSDVEFHPTPVFTDEIPKGLLRRTESRRSSIATQRSKGSSARSPFPKSYVRGNPPAALVRHGIGTAAATI
ncbi:hypothetical protein M413DRAFT_245412 [Hebeloma cylindrosporum]|uniref:Uncharacterized protein n=1 Tax=Hebeloma cylindrosporum TaxID=76867 RepID=A0A0C3BNY7_HEBCY|nr:hypothetical protein M413DRAFT_245412 [Hebeloma cylindrosporum h7]